VGVSVGPGEGDTNEDAEDDAQPLAVDKGGDVRHQKAPCTVDKDMQKAARMASEATWEMHNVHEQAAQSQVASAGKPQKNIKSDIDSFFVAWELDKQTSVQNLRVHRQVAYNASRFTTQRKRPAQLPQYLHAPTDLTRYDANLRPPSLCTSVMCC